MHADKIISQAESEIKHGQWLSQQDPEHVWGWGSPAGQLRALRRAAMIAAGARLKEGAFALEIGCGTGLFTELFASSKAKILAVDISKDLLEYAKKRNLSSNQIQFLNARFEDCEVKGPFDAVIGSSILHHLDCACAFDSIFALLKAGGWMSFAEPNYLNPQIFIERRFRRFFPQVSPDETAFVRGSLKNKLLQAGFVNVRIEPFDWLHPSIPKKLIPLISFLGDTLEKIPGVREFAGSLHISAQHPE